MGGLARSSASRGPAPREAISARTPTSRKKPTRGAHILATRGEQACATTVTPLVSATSGAHLCAPRVRVILVAHYSCAPPVLCATCSFLLCATGSLFCASRIDFPVYIFLLHRISYLYW